MSDITDFIDEHDLTVADVVDALDIDKSQFSDVPDEPTDFYDGEPTTEDLREDFEAVDMMAERTEDLEATVDELREEVREAKRPVFEDKAEKLTEATERWGDTDDLMAKFDGDHEDLEEDDRWTVDTIDNKLELVEDIMDEEITTTDSADTESGDGVSGGSSTGYEPTIQVADEDKIGETSSGKLDLSSVR